MNNGHVTIQQLLGAMGRLGASDLHIKVGIPPTYRVNGQLRPINGAPLTPEEADHLLDPIVPAAMAPRFVATGNLDFATHSAEGDRFRVNMFRAGGHTHAAIRRVRAEIPTYESLHLPRVYHEVAATANEGLVLVVGVTGSGKSTTLAAMIEHINASEAMNIITVEDPVEYRFIPKRSIISQREIGIDVQDFPTAMKFVVREDPDVIFVGEMRDHQTVLSAIQAAETGHLVFATLHTADTMQSLARMLEFFPPEERAFIRSSLANSLKAVFAQRLLPAVPGFEVGSVPAVEVLLASPVVKEKIREGEDADLPAIIAGSTAEGMRSFTYSLAEMVEREWVTSQTAMAFAPNREALASALKGVQVKAATLVHRIKARV